MTRYEECLAHVKQYVVNLRIAHGLNSPAIEVLVRAFVEQPAYDVTFRDQLLRDAMTDETSRIARRLKRAGESIRNQMQVSRGEDDRS